MYHDHFGLLEAPFSIAPDPRYLYMSERHREALAHLLYGMESDGAFILLTGDVGTGKTTVSRCLLEQVPEDTNLALVLNPKLNSIELLQVICDELRISYKKTELSVKALVDYINRYLLGAHAQGKKTVVLIEEAQNLDLDVLEQLRLLTNLETNERKLLQVILLGQPEFLDVLDRPDLSQLAQRITARFHLGPLKLREVEEYVAHRLAIAGCRRPLFPRRIIKRLFNYSGGVPRLINVICDRALLGCYVQNGQQIDKPTLVNAAKEVLGDNKAISIIKQNNRWFYRFSSIFVLIMLVVAVLYFFNISVKKITVESADIEPVTETELNNDKPVQAAPADADSDKSELEIINSAANKKAETGLKEQGDAPQSDEAMMDQPQSDDANDLTLQESETDSGVQNFIQWPDRNQRLRSNLKSYQILFERWQLNYNILSNGTPCFYAQTQGLSCLHEQSGMRGLRQFNRPAVLTLHDDFNQRQYITLIELSDSTATIVMAGEEQIIPLQQLTFYWKGEFSLLWRAPPGYEDLIRPGSAGKTVLWLSQRLNEINKQPQKNVSGFYDEALLKQVKAFQLREGLNDDGVVGVKTLIHLNRLSAKKSPLLENS
jgi:general secretion pathway protein A